MSAEPILFNLMIADIEKGLGRDEVGGIRLGLRKEVEGIGVCG